MADLAARTALLTAATATGAGTTFVLSPPRFISSAQVIFTGSPSAVVLTIQGSLDGGTTWDTLATFDTAQGRVTGDIVGVAQLAVNAVRANLTTLTAGTAPTVTVAIATSENSATGPSGDAQAVQLVDSTGTAVDFGSPAPVAPGASSASGGVTAPFRLASAANSDNATNVKATGGRVYKVTGYNAAAALRYIKLYSKATAPAAADTPVWVITATASGGFELNFADIGLYCPLGIGFRMVTGAGDADNTSVTAADILNLNIAYA